MATQYDEEQDKRIAQNSEAIRELTEYMHQIRDFHMPWASSPFKTKIRKKFVKPILKISAGVTIGMSLYKGVGVYLEKQKLHKMADRYAEVANRLYNTENNAEVALPFLEKAISIDSECPEYLFTRAYMQGMAATRTLSNLQRPYTKAELDLAHRSYAEAVYLQGLEPRRPESYILQAQILAVLKDAKRAKEAIDKAIELDPKNDFAYIRLAMIQLDCEKDVAGAEKSLAKAEELNPKSKWVWLWKGILATDYKSDPATARSCCLKALEIDPKFDLAHYNLAWALATGKDKNYTAAREEMKKALAVNPDYKEAFYAIGMFYGYEDNYTVAKVWMDKAIELDAKFLPAHLWRGIICGEMGECAEAVSSFDEAIKIDPMNADLYVRRAKMYGKLGKDKDALRDLRFAYEMKPNAVKTLLYLGDAYLKVSDNMNAMRFYEMAIAADAKCDDAYARKADLLVAENRNEDAIAAFDLAISVSQYKPERFWVQKGTVLETLGKTDEALSCFVKARTLNAKFATAWRKEASIQKGKNGEAFRIAMEHYLELNPSDADARKELGR